MQSCPLPFRPTRRRVLASLGVAAGAAAVGMVGRPTRAAAEPANDIPSASVTALRTGIHYSWSRPRLLVIAAAGYTFACRYVSRDTTGKNLTAGEAQSLIAAGIDVVTNW